MNIPLLIVSVQILAEWGVLLGGVLGGGRLLAGRVLRLRHLSVLQLWQSILPQLPGKPDGQPTQCCYRMVMEKGAFRCVYRGTVLPGLLASALGHAVSIDSSSRCFWDSLSVENNASAVVLWLSWISLLSVC